MLGRRVAIAATAAILLAAPAASGSESTPRGYEGVSSQRVAPTLVHRTLRSLDQVVHVARVERDGPYALRTVLSNDAVGGEPRLERTSSMCKRTKCLVAINGDFALPSTGEPVGGQISLGEPLRSPNGRHHQLVIAPDGSLTSGPMTWTARLVSTDLREITIDGVNVPRTADRIVLYTSAHAARTGTNPHGVELPIAIKGPADAIRLDTTSAVAVGKLRKGGNSKISRSGAILSGHGKGAKALADLADRIADGDAGPDALLRIESTPKAAESLGGSPVLVREGRRWFSNDDTPFVRGSHPRTIVGWTPDGDVLLVTVDGRQPGHSRGMSLAEAADLMIGLGATEAINLDGGGSTTFVVQGQVANKPSDRLVARSGRERIVPTTRSGDRVKGNVERPVVSALVVVPRHVIDIEPAPAPTADDLSLPQALAMPAPIAADPASDPTGSMPLVVVAEPERAHRPIHVLATLFAAASMAVSAVVYRRRPSPLE